MSDKQQNPYNPDFTYKKKAITVDKNNEADYPILEAVNNAALYPESIKNDIDMEQFKPLEL
jgi:hypothetical protein